MSERPSNREIMEAIDELKLGLFIVTVANMVILAVVSYAISDSLQ